MPNISEIRQSNFLKKEDCGKGILVTIRSCSQMNVAKTGAPEELKWCLSFDETEKPLVLNSTNAQIIAGICGSEETEDWTNRKIVLYSDPNISFAGKLVGGIRARAQRNQPVPAPKPTSKPAPAPTAEGEADDTPF